MQTNHKSIFSLDDLLLKVNLGVTEEERNTPQDIKISFKFFYIKSPSACASDDINDTFCYHKGVCIIEQYCSNVRAKLIEHLCFQLHKKLKDYVGDKANIWIKVEKCNPPLENFEGAVSFEYSDF